MNRVLYVRQSWFTNHGLGLGYMQDMFKYVTDVNVRSTRYADTSKLYFPGGKKTEKVYR